jgi:hypothetical protein
VAGSILDKYMIYKKIVFIGHIERATNLFIINKLPVFKSFDQAFSFLTI